MNTVPKHRLIRVVASLALVAGWVSGWSDLRVQPKAATAGDPLTQEDILAGVTMHAPDAFYDPPTPLPGRPGALLRSEPLNKDVTLPAGIHGWRILYTTTVDDFTPATAVATVFAPSDTPPSPRSLIAWEHDTTGLLQKCMPSLASEPTTGIPALDRGRLGHCRDGLLIRRERRASSLSDRRRRGPRGARRDPRRPADVRAHARRAGGGAGPLPGRPCGAVDRHHRPALCARGQDRRRRRDCARRNRRQCNRDEPAGGQTAGALCCAVLQPRIMRLRHQCSSRRASRTRWCRRMPPMRMSTNAAPAASGSSTGRSRGSATRTSCNRMCRSMVLSSPGPRRASRANRSRAAARAGPSDADHTR